ncbi:MAG: DUF4129 domain-containing protein [Ardenticatenaceae bacterium]|nr:DUF4129 domain-containing protein [Ardenticatenaceae bacterium]
MAGGEFPVRGKALLPDEPDRAARWAWLQTVWQFARPEFLYLAWAVMEVALLAPLLLAVMPWARFWSPAGFALWLLLVMLIPFNLSRVMSLARFSLFRQQNVLLLAFLLTLLISLRAMLYAPLPLFSMDWLRSLGSHFAEARNPFLRRDLLLFLLLGLLWWRGIALTTRKVDIDELGLRVRVGGLILAPIIIVVANYQLNWSVAGFLLLFFLASLIAIALTRAEQMEQEKTGQNYPMSPRWLGFVLGTSLLIVCTAWAVAAVAGGQSLPIFLRWLQPLWDSLLFSGTVIFTTITYLTLPIMAILERIALFINTLLGRQYPADAPPPPDNSDQVAQQFDALIRWLTQPSNSISFVLNRLATLLVILLVIGLVLLLLERLYARRRLAVASPEAGRAAEAGEIDLESLGLGQRLRQRFGLLRQFRAATIRRIYGQLCQAAAAQGYARGTAETPYEYLATLARAWPQGTADAGLITDAYVRVRYGEVPETREELQAIRAAWRRLERTKPVEVAVQARRQNLP